jgi:hypothetical protein
MQSQFRWPDVPNRVWYLLFSDLRRGSVMNIALLDKGKVLRTTVSESRSSCMFPERSMGGKTLEATLRAVRQDQVE